MADSALAAASSQISAAQTGTPQIKAFFDEPTFTVTYVVHDPESRHAAIIDSVLDYDPASGRTSFSSANALVAFVEEKGLAIDWHLETHAHADHLSAAPYLKEKLGGQIAIGEQIITVQQTFGKLFNADTDFERNGSDFDHLWKDGDHFRIGNLDVTVLHVPGHTPACIAYVIGDAVFVGDTMFMPDYGTARADFPGGDARTLYQSAMRLLSLPPETRLFMCHDYLPEGRKDYVWETTVEAERQANVHIHDGVSEDEFVAMREARDKTLAMPRLILPSVQVNMRAGHFPPAEDNGVTYLKIPVNAV
ncbi:MULTISPECIES: MBL fold metallo-hydrolase [Sphingomonadaceae]|uniref:Glyoxylase-like metal-dependent hydrolase (Beta-lactamase superfamily II) n=2 Tax=Sphingomonadaceae TaxID=41297 RepID=A0A7X5V438_9SPHN|nr:MULTISPECIES: MBL fold metallo-hydrolase [Sphingobium]MBQ8107000.1 MBL fold metallo-hydrolase [Afipia sp.]NIJ67578.1 glyoxylase-like metal-dependent hydrolase (beta-lactamase superfamily II) [Sphingomonas leidyi]ATP19936.1 MBL fold hydrolase [Sphingobium yanoikuyae]KMW30841.1 beta-lactamase [Sphingobium yanoikuyae]NBB39490.1 MBL fold metallo-hydrolase [Sphingobium yanoikuyae]